MTSLRESLLGYYRKFILPCPWCAFVLQCNFSKVEVFPCSVMSDMLEISTENILELVPVWKWQEIRAETIFSAAIMDLPSVFLNFEPFIIAQASRASRQSKVQNFALLEQLKSSKSVKNWQLSGRPKTSGVGATKRPLQALNESGYRSDDVTPGLPRKLPNNSEV